MQPDNEDDHSKLSFDPRTWQQPAPEPDQPAPRRAPFRAAAVAAALVLAAGGGGWAWLATRQATQSPAAKATRQSPQHSTAAARHVRVAVNLPSARSLPDLPSPPHLPPAPGPHPPS